jgi:hypothetical protein
VKSVHALQSMVNDMNLGKNKLSLTFSMIFEVCIKDNQHKTTFSNDGWR